MSAAQATEILEKRARETKEIISRVSEWAGGDEEAMVCIARNRCRRSAAGLRRCSSTQVSPPLSATTSRGSPSAALLEGLREGISRTMGGSGGRFLTKVDLIKAPITGGTNAIHPLSLLQRRCEAALEFYAECGLGSIRELRRYEGTPMAGRDGGAWRNKVLHSLFEGPWLRLYASDGPDSEPMKGCALLIESEGVDDAERLFERMSAEGRVTVPFEKQFGRY